MITLEVSGPHDSVLVNRGWIARGPAYPRPPEVPVPAGPVQVSGAATLPPKRFLELGAETVQTDVWQNLSIERYRARTGIAILPVVVLSDAAAAGLAAGPDKPAPGLERHPQDAPTWYPPPA